MEKNRVCGSFFMFFLEVAAIKFHAILQQGLAVTVSRRQFFSTKTQHFITITALNIKVLHFFKKKGEWKEQNYEIMSSASKLEIIECLLEIYKAVSG